MTGKLRRGWLLLFVMLSGPAAAGGPRDDGLDAITLAGHMRHAIGLGTSSLAAMDVPPDTHEDIVLKSIAFVSEYVDAVKPVMKRYYAAQRSRGYLNDAERRVEVRDEILEAYDKILELTAPLRDELIEMLEPEAQEAFKRAVQNGPLDTNERLLELTAEQRTQLWEVTLKLDTIRANPYQYHRQAKMTAAQDEYDRSVQRLLTPDQRERLEKIAKTRSDNLESAYGALSRAYHAAKGT